MEHGASRYTLLHSAAQALGKHCGDSSNPAFQMISAVLGREIVLLLSVPYGEKHQLETASERLRTYLCGWSESLETPVRFRTATSTACDFDHISWGYEQARELSGFVTMLSLTSPVIFYEDVLLNGWEVYDSKRISRQSIGRPSSSVRWNVMISIGFRCCYIRWRKRNFNLDILRFRLQRQCSIHY